MQIQMQATLKRETRYLDIEIPSVTFIALVVFILFVLFVLFVIITFLYSKD